MGNWASPGLGDVGSYQASGIPYVVSVSNATAKKELTHVTSEITVIATAAATLKLGDTAGTSISIPAGAVATFRVRTKYLELQSGGVASLVASLTVIEGKSCHPHTQTDYEV